MKQILSVISVVSVLVLCSCDGNKKVFVDTYGMRIISGEVTAYEFIKGDKGRKLASSQVLSGKLELVLPQNSNPILLELTSASFIDIASGKTVDFAPNDRWTTILSSIRDIPANAIPLNPITTIGTAVAMYKLAYATDEKEAISKAKSVVGDHFKMNMDQSPVKNEEDIENSTDLEVQTYYLLMAGISRLVQGINELNEKEQILQKITINEFLKIIWEDLSFDGVLDGRAHNSNLTFGVYEFGGKTFKEDLVWAIRLFITENNIYESEEIFTFIQHILNDSSELFISESLADFDAPTIILFSPISSGFSSSIVSVHFEAYDNTKSGISYVEARMIDPSIGLIENLSHESYVFEGKIDTSSLADGSAYIYAKAIDGNNNVAEKIIPFKIDNTKPVINSNLEDDVFVRGQFQTSANIDDEFGSGITKVSVKLAGVEADKIEEVAEGQYNIEHLTTFLADGITPVEIIAEDDCGNTSILTKNIFVNNSILTVDHFSGWDSGSYSDNPYSTEYAGDLNRDGYPDIINTFGVLLNNVGILLGNSSYTYNTPSNAQYLNGAVFSFAKDVAANCDFDNDGNPDFVIGDWIYLLGAGRFTAFFSPLNSQMQWKKTISKGAPVIIPFVEGGFGLRVECADINGDGYDDIISGYATMAGDTYVYYGPNFDSNTKISDYIGEITNIGYINSDSAEDIMLGNRVIFGSSNNLFSNTYNLEEGFDSVGNLGDINDDGFSDIILGFSSTTSPTIKGSGYARVIYGGIHFPTQFFNLFAPEYSLKFGKSVGGADVDGDGILDIVVGAPESTVYKGGQSLYTAGKIFVFLGPDYNNYRVLQSNDPHLYARFGDKIRTGFDINGDSLSDLLVQEPRDSLGSFHVFYDLNQ